MAAKKIKKRPLLPEVPCLLVLHEKHGNRYYHISSEEKLKTIALKIVQDRFKSGYYYYDPKDYKPKALDFTEEQLEAMPASIRDQATRHYYKYKTDLQYWQEETENYKILTDLLATKDGLVAWHFLKDREAEYERVSIERYWND